MIATPITPGRVYRVRGDGWSLTIVASNPCHAMCIALDLIGGAA